MMDNIPGLGRLSRLASSALSSSDTAADSSPNNSGPRGEFSAGALEGGVNCFSEPPTEKFMVRGKQYLSDSRKIAHARPPAFRLLDVDVFESTVGRIEHFAAHPDSFSARNTTLSEFLVVVSFVTDKYHMVITYAVDEDRFMESDPAFRRLWKAFLAGSPDYRGARLKVIPNIVEGPWAVRKAIGEKPAIMGRKLGFKYFRTNRYLEIDCDTAASRAAGVIVEAVVPAAGHLVIDLAFLFEGQSEAELPERIFGTMRVSRMLLKQSRLVTTKHPEPPPSDRR